MKSLICLFVLGFYTFSVAAHTENGLTKTDTISGSHELVDYKVTQNNANIIIQLSSKDTKTIMSMLRRGVTIWFDLKGKEKEDVAIIYPIAPIRMPMRMEGERGASREDQFQSEAEMNQVKSDINTLVTQDFPEEALFQFHDSKQQFNVLLNSIGVSAQYAYNENDNLLTYKLTIPKEKIKAKAKNDLSKLLIGVQTAKPDKSAKEDRPEGMESDMRPGGGNRPQGGGPGGRGGGREGSRGGGQRPGGDSEKAPQGIDFWFEAHM
ncbi:hypothetical protein [Formosa haliotis]|uniref:hypothetical protein n=1 Tax=Formosa haliotis TaxID=1555194 RepID=UPI000825EAF5|nr:hypothetical protein [Formosa haliotis]